MKFLCQVMLLLCLSLATGAFQPLGSRRLLAPAATTTTRTALNENENENDKNASTEWSPLKGLAGMLSSLDDAIDDFMGKRMGNGEVFYGKRKFEPSLRENTEGRYNGMGKSDKIKIDNARERKEDIMERRRSKMEDQKRS